LTVYLGRRYWRSAFHVENPRIANMELINTNQSTAATPKLAATVVVCKPLEIPRNGFDYEILFVKRKPTARFMPGYHVFPGGIVEDSDILPDGHPLLPIPLPSYLRDERRTLRLAAVREVFEESNVLLCDPVLPDETLTHWRPIVLKDCSKFVPMCIETSCKPSWNSLFEWAHWITPKQEKYRYDTYFYLIPLDPERAVQAAHDEIETTTHDWKTPREALEDFSAEKIVLAPPTWITIAEMFEFPTLHLLKQAAQSGRDMNPIEPTFQLETGTAGTEIHLCLPGDKDSVRPLGADILRRLIIVPGKSYSYVASPGLEKTPWQASPVLSKL